MHRPKRKRHLAKGAAAAAAELLYCSKWHGPSGPHQNLVRTKKQVKPPDALMTETTGQKNNSQKWQQGTASLEVSSAAGLWPQRQGRIRQKGHFRRGPGQPKGLCHLHPCTQQFLHHFICFVMRYKRGTEHKEWPHIIASQPGTKLTFGLVKASAALSRWSNETGAKVSQCSAGNVCWWSTEWW